MTFIQTSRVAPVDLNSFLAMDFGMMARFYELLERPHGAQFWRAKQREFTQAIEDVFYDKEDGIW